MDHQTYSPNLKDPRVLSKIKHALGFSLGVLSRVNPHAWSTRYIDKHYGSSSNNLGKWMRHVLLVTTNQHYSKDHKKCKEHLINSIGVDYLRAVLREQVTMTFTEWKNTAPVVIEEQEETANEVARNIVYDEMVVSQWCEREFGDQLQNLNFEYKDQSARLWHPIQNVKREIKTKILAKAGLVHQYDIQCCAPTLIHQHAQRFDMDLYLFSMRKYLSNRNEVRTQLAEEAELPTKVIKVLINALFCGAKLGNNKDFALSKLLNNDTARIELLKNHEFITELKSDIKTCWTYIEEASMYKTYVTTERGTQKKKALTSKRKWNRYFDLERQVLEAVRAYVSETNNHAFLEHDGWTTKNEINQAELIEYVFNKTGFKIKVDYVCVAPKGEAIDENSVDDVEENTTTTYPSVVHLFNVGCFVGTDSVKLLDWLNLQETEFVRECLHSPPD